MHNDYLGKPKSLKKTSQNHPRKYKIKSTVLLLEVTTSQANLFQNYWKQLKLKPGSFNLLGSNYSTHASEAFIAGNIVTGGIPRLDTRNNLYKQLKSKYSGKTRILSGILGAKHIDGDKYELLVE